MILTKLNEARQKERGFTIVELLIVIVVIGILAAITLISYNGITNRANASKAVSNAEQVQKKAEAFNADPQVALTNPSVSGAGYYPATAAIFNAIPSSAIGSTSVTLQANSVQTVASGAVSPQVNAVTSGGTTTAPIFYSTATAFGLPTAANATSVVTYIACATGGANATTATAYLVAYYDQSKSSNNIIWVGSSNLTSVPAAGATIATAVGSCPSGTTASTQ